MGIIPQELIEQRMPEWLKAQEQRDSLHLNYLALLARLIVAGVDPREKYQMVEADRPALHQAGLISMEMYPDLHLPRAFRTPLPDCNEFTNDMVMAFRNSTGSWSSD